MPAQRLILPIALAFFSILCIPTVGFSAEWDAFPELKPREHFAIKRLYDGPKYRDLRSCYRRFDSRVGARYYGAMVEVTAESGSRSRNDNDAGPYASALYDAWTSDGVLNPDTDLLVVFGLRNRSIAIHPGKKWTKIGFDADTIAQTIDASHFQKHLSRRNYSDALCSLLTAVDLRLVTLQQKMKERVDAIEQRLPELDTKLSALHKEVAARFAQLPTKEHPFGQKLLGQLAAARTQLNAATEAAAQDPEAAVQLADKVEAALQPVRSDLKIFNQDMARLDTLEAEVAALKATILAREDVGKEHPKLALLQVSKCEELAQKIRTEYAEKPWQVRDCQRLAEVQLARADVHHYYLRSLLPTLGFALLVLLLIAFVILRTLRRRRALAQLKPTLRAWQRRLELAASLRAARALQAPTYFSAGRAPWVGESAELERPLRDSSARVDALLAQGYALVEQAKAQQRKSHPLDAKRLEKALAILRDTPLSTESSTPDGATRAAQLLGELDAAQHQAFAALQDVLATLERLDTQAAGAANALTRAAQALELRRELGLPAEDLSASLQSATDLWRSGVARCAEDPRHAADTLAHATAQLTEIADAAALGNQAVERIRGPLDELAETLRQRIKQLRFAQIDLDKLSFAPNQALDAAEREATRIVEAAAQGEDAEIAKAVDLLEANLEQLRRRLEIVAQAPQQIPARLKELAARSAELKQRLMDLRYALTSLATQGNPQVYQASSEQVGRYQSQLDRLGKELQKAKQDFQLKRFLSATERLDAATRLLERADALHDELGSLEMTVGVTQAKCEQLLSACKTEVEQLQQTVQKPGIDPDLRALITAQLDAYETLNTQVSAAQADWFDARKQLDSLHSALTFLGAQADADLTAFQQAGELLQRLKTDLAGAPNAAESSEIIGQARQMLDGWSEQMQAASGGGIALLQTGQAVASASARALRLAENRTPDVDTARHQLAHATARRAQVHDQPYGYGVTGDCSPADAELRSADDAIVLNDFARALAHAEAAAIQVDLEDARARAQAVRTYRRARIQNIASPTAPPNLSAFGPRRPHSGGHAAIPEVSEVDA